MSYKKILCCCADDESQKLNDSGGSKGSEGASGVDNVGVGEEDEVEIVGVDEDEEKARPSHSGSRGNPRNKCILKPGHSQMDWFRLSKSKDLSGLGNEAGTKEVTPEELAKHNTITDGWLALNGKVYNVTSYFPFHPGGVDELKKGLGKDATKLFLEAHSWVNSEGLLKSCHVGKLVPSHNVESLVTTPPVPQNEEPPGPSNDNNVKEEEQKELPKVTNQPIDIQRVEVDGGYPKGLLEESAPIHSFRSLHEDSDLGLSTTTQFNAQCPVPTNKAMPSFDWLQKTTTICVSFQGKPFSNPMVETWRDGKKVTLILRYDAEDKTVVNEIIFEHEVAWPGSLRIAEETGKVELTVKKVDPMLWRNYGMLKQTCKMGGVLEQKRTAYVVTEKEEIAENVFVLELKREDGAMIYAPIGYHFRVFTGPDEEDISRSYTPIPNPKEHMFPKLANTMNGQNKVFLLVKKYEDGNVSKHICDSDVGDILFMSRPLPGGLSMTKLHDKSRFLIIAAGTGITPMLSLMVFLLHRRNRKCQKLGFLLCNKKIETIPFLRELEQLVENQNVAEKRAYLRHIVSQPVELQLDGVFIQGHLTEEIVSKALKQVCRGWGVREEDFFVFVCGPKGFNVLCQQYLKKQSVSSDQIHVFDG